MVSRKLALSVSIILTLDPLGVLLHTDFISKLVALVASGYSLTRHWSWLWVPNLPHLQYHMISLLFVKAAGYSLHLEVYYALYTALLCLFTAPMVLSCNNSPLTTGRYVFMYSLWHASITTLSSVDSSFICIFPESWASWIPTTILSHINSSCHSSYWQYLARTYKSVINSSTDSVFPCHRLLNYVRSCIVFQRTVK